MPVPEIPEAAKEPTEEGLEATVGYWWEAAHYLKSTGDETQLEAVSTAECGLCQNLVERWTEIYDLDGWAIDEPSDIKVQFIKMDGDGMGATGAIEVSEAPSQIYRPDGERGGSGDGSENRPWVFSADYVEKDALWKITGLEAQG